MTPVLALDLATATGWALWDGHGVLTHGVQDLSLRRGESPGMRFRRLRRFLRQVIGADVEHPCVEVVAYEQAHHRGGHATATAIGLVTVVLEECARYDIDHSGVHTATLKKHATGSGRSGKPAMIAAACKRWGVEVTDHNEADALCVLAWALEEIGE